MGGRRRRARLISLEALEMRNARVGRRDGCAEWKRGEAARQFVAEWFSAHSPTLRVRTFRDRTGKYGRWLVEIEDPASDERLTEQLLTAGHASRTP